MAAYSLNNFFLFINILVYAFIHLVVGLSGPCSCLDLSPSQRLVVITHNDHMIVQ